jgi:predicted outer membrane repeat protein
VSVSNSTISSNSAGSFGGGLFAGGSTLSMSNSSVNNNSAGHSGGGIFSEATTITISGSTIASNSAAGNGGGIAFEPFLALLSATVSNTTIGANSAKGDGGGVFVHLAKSTDTITFNHVTLNLNKAGGHGGGIYDAQGTVDLHDTLLANNTLFSNVHENLFSASPATAPITSLGYNLSDDASALAFLTQSTDLNNTPALVSTTLQYNGGPNPTFTYALLPGSPAFAKGDGTKFADQCGIVLTHANIGAF